MFGISDNCGLVQLHVKLSRFSQPFDSMISATPKAFVQQMTKSQGISLQIDLGIGIYAINCLNCSQLKDNPDGVYLFEKINSIEALSYL